MPKLFRPEKIYVEEGADKFSYVASVLGRFPGIPTEIITDKKGLLEQIQLQPDPIGAGKRFLLLAIDRGRAFKPFPNPESLVSCHFYSLHLMEGCDLECSYCILQAYLRNPILTVYVNVEEILDQLDSFLKEHPDQFFRIGTGHLADSLSLDHVTAHTKLLVPFFSRQPNAILEFKTKSTNIAGLKGLKPRGRTVVSWSMNTKRIQREEEHKCSSIEDRIDAARQCVAWGYQVGFHFDPLIDYMNCLQEYEEVIEQIFSAISQERVVWISFGSFRFMPELKSIMEKRFPKSPLPHAEWIRGQDGKIRYLKSRRMELYSHLVQRLRRAAPKVPVYLCMETEGVWKRVFGEIPDSTAIAGRLNQSVLIRY